MLVYFFLALLGSLLAFSLLALLIWRPLLNFFIDRFIRTLIKDPYPENIFEMYNVISKVGVQNLIEGDLRGSSGGILKRPFGAGKRLSDWDQLTLNTVYFVRKPVVESVEIDTKVTIGPKAKRPLVIDLPLMIAGMGYGWGLSLPAKVALAKAADLVKTATNTGSGPFLPEERKYTKRLIIQYHRGNWGKEEEVLRQADAIEIQLGYGAYGSAPVLHKYEEFSPEFRDYMRLRPGQDLLEEAGLPGVDDRVKLRNLVDYLRRVTNGVPIGVKIAATNLLEEELAVITEANIDFLSIAGAEAGIAYGPGITADDCGLPTLPALCRTAKFLQTRRLTEDVSLIVSGGFYNPGQVLKALVLGADAVALGTILLLVMAHTQSAKVLPWEPPTELLYDTGKLHKKFSVDQGAQSVANFLKSCHAEIKLGMRNLGLTSLQELSLADIAALTPEMAQLSGAELAFFPPQGMVV
ncbi:MAG TPA: FMN-binding glutamate synthase family protein [Bacillota bacterium]